MKHALNLLVCVLTLALALSLCACNESSDSSVTSSSSNSSSSSGNGGEEEGDTTGGGGTAIDLSDAHYLVLKQDGSATLDGEAVTAYDDYVWHADPSVVHDDVKDSPAEYYTGTEPTGDEGVYIARDVIYLPDTLSFTGTAKNDGETEQACYYDDEVIADYIADILANEDYSVTSASNFIFATLPSTQAKDTMLHSAEDALENPVIHINEPGTYVVSGQWDGQIWIDGNGDDEDDSNKVILVLNGVSVTCTVAPALVFHDVYECGPDDNTTYDVDISEAGAQVYVVDDTTNDFVGANVYRMLKVKPKYDNDDDEPTTVINGSDVSQQKKRWKMDGAFYSFVSMLINGTVLDDSDVKGNGVLNITSSTYEGMGAELHMTVAGGVVNVSSPDDGINVNEDGYSVFTLDDGSLNVTSSGGDGVDSNGWIVINDGSGTVQSGGGADHGLDADNGVYILGGSLNADSAANVKVNEGSGTIGTTGGDVPGGDFPGGDPPV